ncbi:MAG: hypothetical protein AAGI17_01940 [Planctomycetota bacterium]
MYTRTGSDPVTLQAVPGRRDPEASDTGQTETRRVVSEWLVNAADLTAGGLQLPPARGDSITATLGGVARSFLVVDLPGEGTFRFTDATQTLMAINVIDRSDS